MIRLRRFGFKGQRESLKNDNKNQRQATGGVDESVTPGCIDSGGGVVPGFGFAPVRGADHAHELATTEPDQAAIFAAVNPRTSL